MFTRHVLGELHDGADVVWRSVGAFNSIDGSRLEHLMLLVQATYVRDAIHQLGLDASAVGITLPGYGVGMVVRARYECS